MINLDLEIAVDELVYELREDGKAFELIREMLIEQVNRAIDELELHEHDELEISNDDYEL